MEKTSLNIFEYTCYRAFLCAHAEEKKSHNLNWSYGLWAKKLGLSGTASLTMILNGQRNPGKSVATRFLQYFKFNSNEAKYFETLICLEKVKNNPHLSILIMEDLSRQSPKGTFTKIGSKELRVISKWHYYAIREMLHLKDFNEDPEWIVSKLNFKVTVREVKQAIQDLLSLGLLKRDENGQLACSYRSLDTESEISNEYLKRFHEQMINHGQTAIRKIPVDKRSINGITLTMNQKDISKVKELISKFQDQLCKIVEVSQGDTTYQCNIQFFPLTRDKEA